MPAGTEMLIVLEAVMLSLMALDESSHIVSLPEANPLHEMFPLIEDADADLETVKLYVSPA